MVCCGGGTRWSWGCGGGLTPQSPVWGRVVVRKARGGLGGVQLADHHGRNERPEPLIDSARISHAVSRGTHGRPSRFPSRRATRSHQRPRTTPRGSPKQATASPDPLPILTPTRKPATTRATLATNHRHAAKSGTRPRAGREEKPPPDRRVHQTLARCRRRSAYRRGRGTGGRASPWCGASRGTHAHGCTGPP